MNDLEQDIKEALKKQDATYKLGDLSDEEMSISEMLVSTFRGKMRAWSIFIYCYIFLFMAIAITAGISFFEVESVKWQIFWAAIFQISLLIIIAVKIWYWMLMNRNATTREVKRLELRIVDLKEQLKNSKFTITD